MKGKLLIVADAACATGFAQVSHNLIMRLHNEWEISVLAVNYKGDPHPIQQYAQVYSPQAVQPLDYYGYYRINDLQKKIKPDVVLHINDPWVLSEYMQVLKPNTPGKLVFYTPVDAINVKSMYITPLNKFDRGIAYTKFGADVLIAGGYNSTLDIIPHGVDTTIFFPMNKIETRQTMIDKKFVQNLAIDDFIVQIVDRNSLRKRIDLALYGFALWANSKPKNVKLWYHGALMDEGYDIAQLADFFGISDRMIYTSKTINPATGVDISMVNAAYNAADVKVSLSGGEGWGLTAMESMATRTANMVVNAAAYSEWAKGGVHYIKPSGIPLVSTKGLNTIQAQADLDDYILGLERMYSEESYRKYIANAGYEIVTREEYTWSNIASRFDAIFTEVLNGHKLNSDTKDGETSKGEVYQEANGADRELESAAEYTRSSKKSSSRRSE